MLCMVCKQSEAKVHLTQVVDGKLKKVDLCEECAKAKGVDDPTGFSLADLLMGLGAAQEVAEAAASPSVTCPACGYTQADFKKSGRFGCAECYRTFADGLESFLRNMHKGTRHMGKVPRALRQGHEVQERIKQLQKHLNEAIAAENYEDAARLRDEIKSLKEGLSNVLAESPL